MGFWKFCRLAWNIFAFVCKNPLLSLAILAGTVLLLFGLIYSIRKLLRPSTWGVGRPSDLEKEQPTASIFTALAVVAHFAALGTICYFSLKLYHVYGEVASDLDRFNMEIRSIFHQVGQRGTELSMTIESLNDSLLESFMDLLGQEGELAAAAYDKHLNSLRLSLSALLRATEHHKKDVDALRRTAFRIEHYKADPLFDPRGVVAYYLEDTFEMRELFIALGKLMEEIANVIEAGSEDLKQYIETAHKLLVNPSKDAGEVRHAIEQAISTSLKATGNKIPNVNLLGFRDYLGKIEDETIGKTDEHATDFRHNAFDVAFLAIGSLILALFVLFANRFNYPLMGLLSVAGFIYFFYVNWSFQYDTRDNLNFLFSTCKSFKDNGDGPGLPLFNILNQKITTKELLKFFQSIVDKNTGGDNHNHNSNNLLRALRDTFGDGKQFDDCLRISANQIEFQGDKNEFVALCLDFNGINQHYSGIHSQFLKKLTLDKSFLQKALEEHRKNAELCANASNLPFPPAWIDASQMIKAAYATIDGMVNILNFDEYIDRLPKDHDKKTWGPMLEEFEAILDAVSDMANTVITTSDRLEGSCKSQLAIINELELKHPISSTQSFRTVEFGAKAERLLPPIFESRSFVRPLERCHGHVCSRVSIQAQILQIGAYYLHLALIVAIVSALYLTRFIRTIFRGIMCCFPCLEVFRICK